MNRIQFSRRDANEPYGQYSITIYSMIKSRMAHIKGVLITKRVVVPYNEIGITLLENMNFILKPFVFLVDSRFLDRNTVPIFGIKR